MTNAGALRAATLNASLFTGYDNIGTVEEGKLASLVILNGNPLEDISQTSNISSVIYRGNHFDRARLDKILEEGKRIAAETKSN